MKHYKEKLSAYLHHELPKDERQTIGEHLRAGSRARVGLVVARAGVALARARLVAATGGVR